MTQEFVAESLGVSRQAVSKRENGISDPSTSNLFALAKLYGVSAEEIVNKIKLSNLNSRELAVFGKDVDKDKGSDVYIVAKDFSWTYVCTHEFGLGPYLCIKMDK